MAQQQLTREQEAFVKQLFDASDGKSAVIFTEETTMPDGRIVKREVKMQPHEIQTQKPSPPARQKPKRSRAKCWVCSHTVGEWLSYTERGTGNKRQVCVGCADRTEDQAIDVGRERYENGYYPQPAPRRQRQPQRVRYNSCGDVQFASDSEVYTRRPCRGQCEPSRKGLLTDIAYVLGLRRDY